MELSLNQTILVCLSPYHMHYLCYWQLHGKTHQAPLNKTHETCEEYASPPTLHLNNRETQPSPSSPPPQEITSKCHVD